MQNCTQNLQKLLQPTIYNYKQSQLQTATTTYCYTSVIAEAPLARSWYKTNKSATQQHQTTTNQTNVSKWRRGFDYQLPTTTYNQAGDQRWRNRAEKLLKPSHFKSEVGKPGPEPDSIG